MMEATSRSYYETPTVQKFSPPTYTSANYELCDATNLNQPVSEAEKLPSRNKCHWCMLAGLVLVGVVVCTALAIAVWSIVKVSSTPAAEQNMPGKSLLGQFENINESIIRSVSNQVGILANRVIPQVETSLLGVNSSVVTIKIELDAVIQALFGQIPAFAAPSCLNLSLTRPSPPSGYYWVRASNGSAVHVYCDMTRSCGDITGGWMRVASLDFTNAHSPCPVGFRVRDDSGIRTCGITDSTSAACASVNFNIYGIPYSRVCGKVLAYQFGSTDAFNTHGRTRNPSINSNYVDGVSLTHGLPREHIWTFASSVDELGGPDGGANVCECSHSGRPGGRPPVYVGQDYFCDSGVSGEFPEEGGDRLFSNSPLWDGSGCGASSTCCSFNNPPWFHKQFLTTAVDDIELRACIDEERSTEDIALSSVEIYVQ